MNFVSKFFGKGASATPKMNLPAMVSNALQPFQEMENTTQDKIDVCKGVYLMKCYDWRKANFSGNPSEAEINQFYEEIKQSSFSDLQASLYKSINDQMESLFESIHSTVEELDEDIPSYDDELANRLIQKNNFVVEVKKSKIPQAQLGVFNRGTHVPLGQVMCLFPGLVHLPQYLTNEYMDKYLLPDDHYYLMARMDGCVIDGRTSHKTPYNPYGIGHMVNHPPRFTEPNVLQLMFDFPGDPWGIDVFPEHLQTYIPNLYAKKPTLMGTPDRSALMRTVVLVASKPIAPGDELLMDYRLNPAIEAPSWYVQVDESSSKKRWEKVFY